MADDMQTAQEAVGPNFDAAMLLEARRLTRRAVDDIAAGIAPGMAEEARWTWPEASSRTPGCCGAGSASMRASAPTP